MIYTRSEIAEKILPIALKYQIRAVYLFGSYARGEATEESDVDLLIDTTGMTIRGMQFGALYCDLEDALGKGIDLITMNALKRPTLVPGDAQFLNTVEREKVAVYGAA